MISETARSRPNATSSQSEAPTGANTAAAMMVPVSISASSSARKIVAVACFLWDADWAVDDGQAGAGLTT